MLDLISTNPLAQKNRFNRPENRRPITPITPWPKPPPRHTQTAHAHRRSVHPLIITGLALVIHVLNRSGQREVVDNRVKPGHDGRGGAVDNDGGPICGDDMMS